MCPFRIQYKSPAPYYTETNYGLFQKCSTLTDDCRRFPQREWGDCGHDRGSGRWVKLCTEWRVAGGLEIAAAVVGLWILAGLTMVLYTGQRWHAHGWKHILGLIGIYGKGRLGPMSPRIALTSALYSFCFRVLSSRWR